MTDSDSHDRLDRAARDFDPAPDAWDRTMKRATTRRRGRKAVAAIAALAVTLASLTFLWRTFDGGGGQPAATSSMPEAVEALGLDPDQVCDVPTYDPDLAILAGGSEVNEYPRSVLEAEGQPSSEIQGAGADALRRYLARMFKRYPAGYPADGWRMIASTANEARFAAPLPEVANRWVVVDFDRQEDDWKQADYEYVDLRPTPAQVGRGFALNWKSEVVLQGGSWNRALALTSSKDTPWVPLGYEDLRAIPYVFDTHTGEAIGDGSTIASEPANSGAVLDPGDVMDVPLALGSIAASLEPGTYIVVSCVPELGLASPPGTLRVEDGPAVAEGHILTYQPGPLSMQALGGGILTMHNGCVAVGQGADGGRPFTYVLWPHGYALIERTGRTVLINPVGKQVGAMGDKVRLGGGYVSIDPGDPRLADAPAACRTDRVEAYFVTSGPADEFALLTDDEFARLED